MSKHTRPPLHNVINPLCATPTYAPPPTVCCLLPSRAAQFERQMQYCGLAAETLETKWHAFARFASFFPHDFQRLHFPSALRSSFHASFYMYLISYVAREILQIKQLNGPFLTISFDYRDAMRVYTIYYFRVCIYMQKLIINSYFSKNINVCSKFRKNTA